MEKKDDISGDKSQMKAKKERLGYESFMFILSMGFLVLADLYYSYSITPYAADIVLDFGITDDKRKASPFVGILMSGYCLGLVVSSFFWSLFSDCFGRRITLISSLVFLLTLTVLSAFSFNYYYLLVIRIFMGLCSAIVPVTETALGENKNIHDDWRPFAFFLLGFWNCLGSVISPPASGYLSRPTKQYPTFFDPESHHEVFKPYVPTLHYYFDLFPLFLPSLVGVIVLSIGLVCLIRYGYETNEAYLRRKKRKNRGEGRVVIRERRELRTIIEKEDSDDTSMTEFLYTSTEVSENEYYETESYSSTEVTTSSTTFDEEKLTTEKSRKRAMTIREYLVNPTLTILMFTTVKIGLGVFNGTIATQWSMLVEHKGLGLTNYQISNLEFVMGVAGCVASIVAPIALISWLNPVWVLRILPFTMLLLVPFYPEVSYLANAGRTATMWIILFILQISTGTMLITIMNSVLLIKNNSFTKERRAKYNGLSGLIGGIGKAVAPFFGNVLFEWTSLHDVFPFDVHFTFFLSTFLFFSVCFFGFALPLSLSDPIDNILEKDQVEEMSMSEDEKTVKK